MITEFTRFKLSNEDPENKEEERLIVAKIAEYQRDRSNEHVRREALEGIKKRTLVLSKEEYEKYIDEKYSYLPEQERKLRKLGGAFSYTPGSRAVLNKDSLSLEIFPYVRTHEEMEILEDGPFPEEKRKWEDGHDGEKHPQEYINSHVEATYAEYRQAKQDSKLDSHHASTMKDLRNIVEGDKSLEEMIGQEEAQRNHIYEKVKNETP